MNKGRLQFRHFESIFESRENAYKYIEDIVNRDYGEGNRLDESLMAEPIVVAYKDADQKPQAIVCIGVEGEKGNGVLKPYHIIDSAKLEEEIQSMSADIKQELKKEIESAISNLQKELDATQTGAGLDTGGKYISHNNGNYISGATSIDNATVLLDSALKTESDRATALQSELDATQTGAGLDTGGKYISHNNGNYIATATSIDNATVLLDTAIAGIEDKISDNEKVVSEAINQLKAELDRTEAGAGLNGDGTYTPHNTAGDMGNYISNANSLDEADVLLDVALKDEETRATNAENSISGIVNTFSAATESIIRGLQEQLTEANSTIETLRTELQTLSGVVETIESQMTENIYSTVKAMLQGTSKQIKVTPDDANEQITIDFADDAIFGQQNNG